jgi:hypothetical protein
MQTILPLDSIPFNNVFIANVTPERAQLWLAYNRINRPPRPKVVDEYVRQIESGQWKRTHQGIAFTREGALLDGQHRLFAIIRTGRTLPFLVFVNEPAENYEFIDNGRARSNLDMLRLGQRDNSLDSVHLETLRSFLAGGSCKTRGQWTSAELNVAFQKYGDAVHFAVNLFQDCDNKNINDATVRGVIARAQYYVPNDRLTEFVIQLIKGDDYPIISAFRKNLLAWSDRRENTKREIYRRCEITLKAFLTNSANTSFGVSINELFPLPK